VCFECSSHPLLIYCPLCKIRINDRMNVFVWFMILHIEWEWNKYTLLHDHAHQLV
jgi:hypothetical protein